MIKYYFTCLIVLILYACGAGQGFLHTQGVNIVDGDNNNVLLRGMGLGGWMLQEGYMMKTSEFANAQYQIKAKIEALIGAEKTSEFYHAWLDNYMQKADVDSLKSWGFNSIRLPMHYNLYTLPIEDEPVKGENTWLDKGFELTDRLLQWCSQNEMYLFLDLHAAPGGQGKESGISDYNPSKPSLWESEENRQKTVALWKKLAERYADEPWIGGYDLINETNWTMTNNKPLKDLYLRITDAIREVDTNHIICIEGNWFANDFTGLTPPWDENMVYSFHKYWSYNDRASIQWMLNIRNRYHIPIWCGEAGENSNVWFTDAIRLFEENNIGWAWWPLKKIEEIDGPLSIRKSPGYDQLLNYWAGTGAKPSTDFAVTALMQLADNLKLANCIYQRDVIDAMFRQVETRELEPFVRHDIPGLIFATDYDLGSVGYAYMDDEVADYHLSTNTYTSWNNGWAYRNDGVDIESCSDNPTTNGYNVGWITTDEWLAYTVNIDQTAAYDVSFRIAAQSTAGRVHLELDDRLVSSELILKSTGDWQNWTTVTASGIILEQGQHILKLYVDGGGFNLNFLEIDNPSPDSEQEFTCLAAALENDGRAVTATFNKKIKLPLPETPGFTVRTSSKNIAVSSFQNDQSGYHITFNLAEAVFYEDRVYLSYSGDALRAVDDTQLQPFTDLRVKNTLEMRHAIPGIIQAEAFHTNVGFELENTSDTGGGRNLGYSDVGDYADYLVTIQDAGTYEVNFRIASESAGGRIDLLILHESGAEIIGSATFPVTGGWQTWRTVASAAEFPEGRYTLRLKVTRAGFNLNWMQFKFLTRVEKTITVPIQFQLMQNVPNPFNPKTRIQYVIPYSGHVTIKIYNLLGEELETVVNEHHAAGEYEVIWNATQYPSGLYFCTLRDGHSKSVIKMMLQK